MVVQQIMRDVIQSIRIREKFYSRMGEVRRDAVRLSRQELMDKLGEALKNEESESSREKGAAVESDPETHKAKSNEANSLQGPARSPDSSSSDAKSSQSTPAESHASENEKDDGSVLRGRRLDFSA